VDSVFVNEVISTLSSINSTSAYYSRCHLDNSFLDLTSITELSESLKVPKDKWKLRFSMSHSFTKYYNTDLKLKSSRVNGVIKDYTWTERGSRAFFNPNTWMVKGHNVAQIIDEPTNTFKLGLEKNGHEFFLSAFHPKFFQENQKKHIIANIDGVEVDSVEEINKPFDGYNQTPGELELGRNQNTGGEMIFEIGYGHRFKLLKGKAGSLVYTPGVAVGVTTGSNYTSMIRKGEWWESDAYSDLYRVQGGGGSVQNRLEYELPNEKVSFFYENKLSFYKQKHGFLDGTQSYDLKLMGNNIGVTFMIFNPDKNKNKNKKKN